jgi:hypothetical protein
MSHEPSPKPQKPLSFDEFRLVYDSAERVTDRRVELNRWNYSINVAILIAVAAIANWSFQNPPLFWFAIVAAGVLCLMAIFLCSLWIGQVRDMKLLNNAKFKVLEEMAPRVEFDLGTAGVAESYEPFRREWEILQQMKGLRSLRETSIRVLRASNHEFFIPRAFQALFVVLIGFLIWFAVMRPSAHSQSAATTTATTAPIKP